MARDDWEKLSCAHINNCLHLKKVLEAPGLAQHPGCVSSWTLHHAPHQADSAVPVAQTRGASFSVLSNSPEVTSLGGSRTETPTQVPRSDHCTWLNGMGPRGRTQFWSPD